MAQALLVALDASNFMLALLLVTLGLVILFGLMNVINMAHGEMFLLGAYAVVLVQRYGGSFWLALALAPLALGVIGLVIEEVVIRHVYHRFIDTILATWGLSKCTTPYRKPSRSSAPSIPSTVCSSWRSPCWPPRERSSSSIKPVSVWWRVP